MNKLITDTPKLLPYKSYYHALLPWGDKVLCLGTNLPAQLHKCPPTEKTANTPAM